MFLRRTSAAPAWIIAGLGNPGKKYEHTRHNIGFDALDHAAAKWGIEVKRMKFHALSGLGQVAGQNVLLLKPQTFMNLSGESLLEASQFYKLPSERILVLVDDIALAPGLLRLRLSGSDGGHNGLKSLTTFLGEGFLRLRIGVGDRPQAEYELASWVTSRFTAAERKTIEARFDDVAAACERVLCGQSEEAMALYNGAGKY